MFLKPTHLIMVVLMAAAASAADTPNTGSAKKDGLSLAVTFDKKSYGRADEVQVAALGKQG
jgi:hypothetical protein